MSSLSPTRDPLVWLAAAALLAGAVTLPGCGGEVAPSGGAAEHVSSASPSILLVTLDTTRADVLGYAGGAATTPVLDGLAAEGVRFEQAYATAPTTLPSHVSMLTGRYPSEHGVHENARFLDGDLELVAERLRARGYRTGAFVSGYPLARTFGLAAGFDRYDDDFDRAAAAGGEPVERRAAGTTARAVAWLDRAPQQAAPVFAWVHYYDPHEPYDPPPPFDRAEDPYLGEIAAMDEALGTLLDAFRARADVRVVVVGDHGEGRGDHGEALHGNLLYQGVMRVPLLIAGDGVAPALVQRPVSTRRIFDTLLAWAGDPEGTGLLDAPDEPVLGEAMKPFLQYGWQPQVMAVQGRSKAIRAGGLEVYDVVADPAESYDLGSSAALDRAQREALRGYPIVPAREAESPPESVDAEDRARLASLGYADWDGRAPLRTDAPAPRDMTHLFTALDRGSGLFVAGRYDQSIEVFEQVLAEDPRNLMVCVRLAVAHSQLGRDAEALAAFEQARTIDPGSQDVRHYLGMHHLRFGRLDEAGALLSSVLAQAPDRVPTLVALARIRLAERRPDDAEPLLERLVLRDDGAAWAWQALGSMRMARQDTAAAIDAFERARLHDAEAFDSDLELGVLYLADQRLDEAAQALDAVSPRHPAWPMALFKRAQVAALRGDPDRDARIRAAIDGADDVTRALIARERLFR